MVIYARLKGKGRVWAFVEDEGEMLKADRLYSILVDQTMLSMLEEENEEKDNKEERDEEDENNEEKFEAKVIDKEALKQDVEGNVSEGSNGWESKKTQELWLNRGKQERELGGNCLSRKLLVRTQRWKKDGVLLVRTSSHLILPKLAVLLFV